MQKFENQPIISDQVDVAELAVIIRELRKVLDAGVAGDVVELGCYEGTTSLFLQRELFPRSDLGKKLWVYDSFAGLPEKTGKDQSPVGTQFKAGELFASKAGLVNNFKKANLPLPKIKKAWFSELRPDDLPQQICFAFLDGDFYESILDSLKLVWPNLAKGAVVVVDDYANESLPGASRAVDEWINAHAVKILTEKSLALLYY